MLRSNAAIDLSRRNVVDGAMWVDSAIAART